VHLELKRFFKHTAVYTIGNLIYRGASFLLVPLYAHYLTPADYGALELLYATSAIFQSLFASGLAHAAMRFYFEYEDRKDRNAVISTTLAGSFVMTLAGALMLCLFAPQFSKLLFHNAGYTFAFRIVFLSMVLEISREISLAVVRSKEQSAFFIAVSVVQLLVQVIANSYAVVVLHKGVAGVLVGNLLATSAVWVILTAASIRGCGVRFEWSKLVPVARYGLPLMYATVTGSLLQNADRYLLDFWASLSALGVYALAVRISNVVPILLLDPFMKSFGPFRFSIMKQERAKEVYATILTYYVIASGFVTLGLCAFTEEAVKVISAPAYWDAYKVVPILLLTGPIGGINYCFQTGIYIHKKTNYIFYISLASGVANLGLDLLLIPRWGIYGAAAANVLGQAVATVLTYAVSQRIYPVSYHLRRLAKVSAALVVAAVAVFQGHFQSLPLTIAVKLGVLALFPLALILLRAYTPEEARKLGQVWGRLRRTQSGVTVS
jgi:O-antigen/teichoic acid export membrane protein